MRLFILSILTLALITRANSQTFILGKDEVKLIDSITSSSNNKPKYFVFLDKNDCFNCTLSASLIKKEIDTSQVFVIANQIPKHLKNDFVSTYGLSNSFNYVYSEKLLQFFKAKSNTLFTDKSFIAEVNASFTTIIPLKKFQDISSFGKGIELENEKTIFNKGCYISAISKFIPFSENFIAFTSPKNSIYYFAKDSLQSGISLDSNSIKKAFDYVLSQQPDSVTPFNSFSKCMETYDTQLKKLGLSIITPQNFTINEGQCYALLQVSFPIWTSDADVTFTGELFLVKLDLEQTQLWQPQDITPINNSDLPNGKSIFAYNYFSYNPIEQVISVGYYLDSNLIKDKSSNHNHCEYELNNGIFTRKPNCTSHHPKEAVDEYLKSQNIALIHQKLNAEAFHYTYVPIVTESSSKFILPIGAERYHNYASKILKNGFIDLGTINGKCYLIEYQFIDNNYTIKKITNINMLGRLQSAISTDKGFDYIRIDDGIFYRGMLVIE